MILDFLKHGYYLVLKMSSFGEMSGRESCLSSTGRSSSRSNITPVKKTYKYRKVAEESHVDETLFKTSAVKLTPKPDPSANGDFGLLKGKQVVSEKTKAPVIKTPLKGMPRTRNQYRIVKHSPSYVDESLFGPKLQTPSFPAPWEKKETSIKGQTLTWSPPVHGTMSMGDTPQSFANSRPFSAGTSRPGSAGVRRPGSAGATRPNSATGNRSNQKQPWK